MAIEEQRQEPIEPIASTGRWGALVAAWQQPHRRPVLICSAAMFTLILGASVSMVMPTKAAPRRERNTDGPARLEPSSKSAREMIAQELEPDAGGAAAQEFDQAPVRLVVPTDGPGSARAAASGAAGNGRPLTAASGAQTRIEPTFQERKEKQYEEYLLALQAARLKTRVDSLKSDTLVDSFDRVRREETEEIAGLFGGQLGAESDGPGGAPGGIGDITKMANSAMKAMGSMGRGGASGGSAAGAQANALLGMLGRGAAGGAGAPGAAGAGSPEADAEAYQEKLAFFQNGGQQLPSAELTTKMKAARPYTLPMGHEIRGMLVTKTISEAPGIIKGVITETVRDRMRNVLIPQGTEVVGTYSARIASGNARLQVAWTRLNFPDARTLDLESMPGASTDGSAGMSDQVDRHIAKRIGAVLMSSAFTVGYELTIPQTGNLFGSAVSRGVGENVTNFGVDLAREIARQSPVITLRQGSEFLILLNKDVSFEGPYEDGVERSTVREAMP